MLAIASPQPKDRFGAQVGTEQAGAVPAIQTNVSGTLLSSMVALDPRATVVEVTTGNGPAGIKWWGSVIGSANIHPSMTTANFDHAIPANTIRRFVIPQSVIGAAHAGSVIGGLGAQNGLYPQMTVIPLQAIPATSVFTSQFV